MPQNELNRSVARATGESVGEIARMGFHDGRRPAVFHAHRRRPRPHRLGRASGTLRRRCDPHRCGQTAGVAFH